MELIILRSKRRTLSLQIKRADELIIKAPLNMKEERIFAFIKQKEGWINKANARLKTQENFKNEFDFDNFVYLLGEKQDYSSYNLLAKIKNNKIEQNTTKINHEAIYKKFAKEYLPKKAHEISEKMGLWYKELKITTSKRCWGSYSRDGKMKLNWKLVILPEALITYVIVHELCHSKELNHSPKFWNLVGQFIPNYKVLKKAIYNYGFLL